MTNFEKYKQDLTPDKLLEQAKLFIGRCGSLCPADNYCESVCYEGEYMDKDIQDVCPKIFATWLNKECVG